MFTVKRYVSVHLKLNQQPSLSPFPPRTVEEWLLQRVQSVCLYWAAAVKWQSNHPPTSPPPAAYILKPSIRYIAVNRLPGMVAKLWIINVERTTGGRYHLAIVYRIKVLFNIKKYFKTNTALEHGKNEAKVTCFLAYNFKMFGTYARVVAADI